MTGWASARQIVGALKGRWAHHSGTCKCPAHEEKTPSLSVSETKDGRVLVHCFGGCDQRAVIDALKRLGLWGGGELTMDPGYPGYVTTRHDPGINTRDERSNREYARELWDKALPAKGTPVEEYLRARGIRLPLSDQLRYLPRLKHTPSKQTFRAMIARLSDDRGICAVQRTWLDNSEPKKADVAPNKMTLGPMADGAVRFRMPATDTLGLAEGIETALSASQIYSYAVWAVCGAQRLAQVRIPETVANIIVFGDSGAVGREQAFRAADHYEGRGFHLEVVFPAAHFGASHGDFNEVVQGVP